MPVRLSDLFDSLVPATMVADDALELSARTFSQVPSTIESSQLVVDVGHRNYDSVCRRDFLTFYAHRETYQRIGFVVAAALFSAPAEIVLTLTHPSTKVRTLVVRRAAGVDTGTPGLHAKPFALNYYPSPVNKHPWHPFSGCPADLPGFYLTNRQEMIATDNQWATRDTVVGFGSDAGMARLLELLLNIGRSSSATVEYDLEGDGGFRGVAPYSSEVRLLLPGSVGWPEFQPSLG